MNVTASAKAANYRCSSEASFANVGLQNFRKLEVRIREWMDDVGFSDNRLKAKLISLLDAKETKFFQFRGSVTEEREVEALSIQLKALNIAMKAKGMFAPEKKEVAGKDGKPLVITTLIPEPLLPDEDPNSDIYTGS